MVWILNGKEFGCLWHFGFNWISLDAFGFVWICLDSFGFIWILLALFGFVWIGLGSVRVGKS